ncbi:NAD(P)-binding protein [Cadophora sp. DSE1049]|nr:NAD(P)-binding protein [Cadophora sp. DSE1049]
MAGTKILVFGGTGPAGICLLRELVYRKHAIIVYARSPSKIPLDLAANPLIEVIQGDLSNHEAISSAVSRSSGIISLLGPNIKDRKFDPSVYSTFYSSLFTIMRSHGVRRILAMGTISIKCAEDSFSLIRSMVLLLMPILYNTTYQSILKVREVFEKEGTGNGIDWTVFRIGAIPGGDDEESWKKDRNEGAGHFVGWVGEKGWRMGQKRGALARWLVDAIEGGADQWIGKMPAVAAGTLP